MVTPEVNPNGVIVMADTAERPEEIDLNRANLAFETANKEMAAPGLDPEAPSQIP